MEKKVAFMEERGPMVQKANISPKPEAPMLSAREIKIKYWRKGARLLWGSGQGARTSLMSGMARINSILILSSDGNSFQLVGCCTMICSRRQKYLNLRIWQMPLMRSQQKW